MMQCPSPSGPGAYLVPDLDQIWQKLVGVCGGEAGGDAAVKYLLHSAGGEELPGQGCCWTTMGLGWREYQPSLGSAPTDGRLGEEGTSS